MAKRPPVGQITPGNINLNNRPRVRNRDGSISTVLSISVNTGKHETLIPTISDSGQLMSNSQAVDQYRRTGRHLGQFDSVQSANSYAKSLHNDQAKQLNKPPQVKPPQTQQLKKPAPRKK